MRIVKWNAYFISLLKNLIHLAADDLYFQRFPTQTYRFLLTHVKKRILQEMTFTHVRQYVGERLYFHSFKVAVNRFADASIV